MLADLTWQGKPRKAMLWGNRNGFFYVLDRASGEFLLGKPFVSQTCSSGIEESGKPIKVTGKSPSGEGLARLILLIPLEVCSVIAVPNR